MSEVSSDLRCVQSRVGDKASRGHNIWSDELVVSAQSEGEKRYELLGGHVDSSLCIGILQVSTYLLGVHPFMAPLSLVPSIRNGDNASELGTCSVVGKYARKTM